MKNMKVGVISGSARKGKKSHRAAIALVGALQEKGVEAEMLDLADFALPPMSNLISEDDNPPESALKLQKRLDAQDALIFVSPEYNGGYAPHLKNAIDHMSKDQFKGKVIGICAVSAGALGGMRAALAMQHLVLALFGYAVPQMLLVPEVDKQFHEDGSYINEAFRQKVTGFISSFLWLAEAVQSKK